MNNQELTNIINSLKSNLKEEEAFVGCYFYSGDLNESFIRINNEGLILLSIKLLECHAESLNLGFQAQEKDFDLGMKNAFLADSQIRFSHIEVSNQLIKEEESFDSYVETWSDYLMKYVLMALLFILLASIPVGLFTMIGWMF